MVRSTKQSGDRSWGFVAVSATGAFVLLLLAWLHWAWLLGVVEIVFFAGFGDVQRDDVIALLVTFVLDPVAFVLWGRAIYRRRAHLLEVAIIGVIVLWSVMLHVNV